MLITITGGAGFIGSTLAELAIRNNQDLVIVDNLLPDSYSRVLKEKNLEDLEVLANEYGVKLRILINDINDKELQNTYSESRIIYNLAAMPGLLKSWSNFETYVNSNLLALNTILKSMSKDTILIQASTSSVYGKNAIGSEESICEPYSPYGVSKLAAENLIKSYSQNFGIKFNILRYFSVYGPKQRPDMAFHKFILGNLTRTKMEIYGDGSALRTNTYVLDCALATWRTSELKDVNQTYNISGSQSISVIELLNSIASLTGIENSIVYGEKRPGDQEITKGVNLKAKNADLIRNETELQIGIMHQIDYIQRNLELYKKIGL